MITLRTGKIRELAQNMQRGVARVWFRVLELLERHPRLAAVVLSVVGGVTLFVAPAYADSGILNLLTGVLTANVLGPTFLAIAGLLYIFVTLGMLINILLSWLLVQFASYNDFVNAPAVVLGWPLVRDIVNMFFIVVLLVVAFSTIIGYQEFHYKKVLPKLLLMVVLINFSKTLVGIMIDFSQVITLTFVNGFKQAAFGNFTKAFGISQMLNTAQATGQSVAGGAGQVLTTMEQVITTLVFDIVILSVTATVLLIMCIYFLVRVVLLWMLLIFSPIAFFSLALPGKMQKAISALSSDWWSRLGSLLTGGPIVAFFLWLTLAVVQSNAAPFSAFYQQSSSTESASISPTLSTVSSPTSITTMMVAIIMLLTGLNTAVAVSKAAAPKLGEIAQSIKSSGGPVGVASRFTGRQVDRRYNVTGRVGANLTQAGQSLAARGGFIGGLAGGALGRAGAASTRYAAAERGQISSAFESRTKGHSPTQTLQMVDSEIAFAKSTGNKRSADVLSVQRGMIMKDGESIKARTKQYEIANLAAPKAAGDSDEEHEAKAKALAASRANHEAAVAVSDAVTAAEAQGNTKAATDLKEAQAKNPSLQANLASQYKLAGNKIDDYKQAFKDVKTDAWQDSGTFLAYMKASGLVDDKTGKMKDGYQNDDKWKELTSAAGGNRTKYVQAQARALETDKGSDRAKLQLAAMADGADAATVTAGEQARQYVSFGSYKETVKDAAGNDVTRNVPYTAFAETKQGGEAAIQHGERNIVDFADFSRNLNTGMRDGLEQALNSAGLTGSKFEELFRRQGRSATAGDASFMSQPAVARVYASPPTAASYATATPSQQNDIQVLARGQALGIAPPAAAQKLVVEYAMDNAGSADPVQAKQASNVVSNINVEEFKDNPNIQEAILDAIDGKMDKIASLYKESKKNPEEMKKMENFIKTVRKETGKAVSAAASSGTAISAAGAKLDKIDKQIEKDKVLNRIGQQSKKKT
ncbi:MAG: hypothetical protein WA001_02415 [Patescibacteria group bacterium]